KMVRKGLRAAALFELIEAPGQHEHYARGKTDLVHLPGQRFHIRKRYAGVGIFAVFAEIGSLHCGESSRNVSQDWRLEEEQLTGLHRLPLLALRDMVAGHERAV